MRIGVKDFDMLCSVRDDKVELGGGILFHSPTVTLVRGRTVAPRIQALI